MFSSSKKLNMMKEFRFLVPAVIFFSLFSLSLMNFISASSRMMMNLRKKLSMLKLMK